MAGRGRGKEVALQVEVESQEEWEELISKEGLTVIDVYQEWCGPCKAMLSNFKRFKNEIGDELLRFAVAKADSIEALERYRGKCEPCFLFYAGGLLVDVIRGSNSPILQKKMISQLAYEHKVLEGLAERKEIRDPNLPQREDKHGAKAAVDAGAEESDEEESSDEEEDETRGESGMKFGGENIMFESLPEQADNKQVYLEKMFTIAIIKPDIYADGKADEIIDKIRESGFDVLEQMERIFAPEEIQELYSSLKEEENFPEVIKDMCNGPSIILVVSKGEFGDGIIEEWREFLGPELVSEAREHAPKSLRAIYCSPGQPHSNGFHGSISLEAAKRELHLFFPDFIIPKISITHIRPQRIPTTIAVVRPAALESFREEILEKIAEENFRIELQREMQMTRNEVEEFYKEQKDEPFFEELLDNMTSGPMLVMALSAAGNVVEKWRSLLGSKEVEKAAVLEPESFRGKFCVRDVNVNQFHGSETEKLALKEFDYFFPMEQTLVAIKPHAYYDRDAIIHKISQAGYRIVARKEMELAEEKVKDMYHNCLLKEFYVNLANSMMKGPTTFLILSKPNAVADWRALAGPTDPAVAREEAPKSIRALFGKDILQNAVHSPSSLAAAKEELFLVFGDIEFDVDGLPKRKRKQKRRRSSEEVIRRPVEAVMLDDRDKPGEGEVDDSGKETARESHGEHSEEERDPGQQEEHRHEDKEGLGQDEEQREDRDGQHNEGENRDLEEDKDLEGTRDSGEKDELKDEEERKEDADHNDSDNRKEDEETKEETHSQKDEETKEDTHSLKNEETKEETHLQKDEETKEETHSQKDEGTKEETNSQKDEETKEETHSQKDAGEESKQEADKDDEHK